MRKYDGLKKEIAALKAQAQVHNGSCVAFLNELLPSETGLDEAVYELIVCYSRKPAHKKHFRKEENAIGYLHEYMEKNPPQKGFVFYVDTGVME